MAKTCLEEKKKSGRSLPSLPQKDGDKKIEQDVIRPKTYEDREESTKTK